MDLQGEPQCSRTFADQTSHHSSRCQFSPVKVPSQSNFGDNSPSAFTTCSITAVQVQVLQNAELTIPRIFLDVFKIRCVKEAVLPFPTVQTGPKISLSIVSNLA